MTTRSPSRIARRARGHQHPEETGIAEGTPMSDNTIIMTWPDHAQLTALVEARRFSKAGLDSQAFQRLAGELARARLVASQDIPPDVVTMNSTVQVRDLDADELITCTLSKPDEADPASGRVNVLAPLGMALLGARVGQAVEWPVPGGIRRLRVESVLFQPETVAPPAPH